MAKKIVHSQYLQFAQLTVAGADVTSLQDIAKASQYYLTRGDDQYCELVGRGCLLPDSELAAAYMLAILIAEKCPEVHMYLDLIDPKMELSKHKKPSLSDTLTVSDKAFQSAWYLFRKPFLSASDLTDSGKKILPGWPSETPTTVLSRLNLNRMNQ